MRKAVNAKAKCKKSRENTVRKELELVYRINERIGRLINEKQTYKGNTKWVLRMGNILPRISSYSYCRTSVLDLY